MKDKILSKSYKAYQYLLLILIGYVGVLTGYHLVNIIRYFIKPVTNPLMPLGFFKYIGFPYISFLPFLIGLLVLGLFFAKNRYYKKGYVIFYFVLILIFHLSQSSLLSFFDSFNPYGA